MSDPTTSDDTSQSVSELTILHEAIEATLRERMPKVVHVEAYPELESIVAEPALLFALVDMKPGEDTGTGKTAMACQFQAAILVDATRTRAPLQAAILAAQLANVLRGQYWDLEFVDAPSRVHARPDGSTPELAQFCVWVVDWLQVVHFGEFEWPWPDEAPGTLVFDLGSDEQVEGVP